MAATSAAMEGAMVIKAADAMVGWKLVVWRTGQVQAHTNDPEAESCRSEVADPRDQQR